MLVLNGGADTSLGTGCLSFDQPTDKRQVDRRNTLSRTVTSSLGVRKLPCVSILDTPKRTYNNKKRTTPTTTMAITTTTAVATPTTALMTDTNPPRKEHTHTHSTHIHMHNTDTPNTQHTQHTHTSAHTHHTQRTHRALYFGTHIGAVRLHLLLEGLRQ